MTDGAFSATTSFVVFDTHDLRSALSWLCLPLTDRISSVAYTQDHGPLKKIKRPITLE